MKRILKLAPLVLLALAVRCLVADEPRPPGPPPAYYGDHAGTIERLDALTEQAAKAVADVLEIIIDGRVVATATRLSTGRIEVRILGEAETEVVVTVPIGGE